MLSRDGASTTRQFHLNVRHALFGTIAGVALVGTALVLVGRWSVERTLPERTTTLQAEIDSLRAESAKVGQLAGRLTELEGSYRRLREVMGGEVEASARDILLPSLESRSDANGPGDTDSAIPAVWPLVEAGFITRSFGDTVPGEGPHVGLDIAVPVGSYVRSVGAGLVVEAGVDREYGHFVRIEHDGALSVLYAHNSWTFVDQGDSVATGEVIALTGNSGRSSAPHLHLEIARGGVAVDPLPFVSGRL